MAVWQCFIGRETDNTSDDENWDDYAPFLSAAVEARYQEIMNDGQKAEPGKYRITFLWSMPEENDVNTGCRIVESHDFIIDLQKMTDVCEIGASTTDVCETVYIIDLQKMKQTRQGPEFRGTERPIRRVEDSAISDIARDVRRCKLATL